MTSFVTQNSQEKACEIEPNLIDKKRLSEDSKSINIIHRSNITFDVCNISKILKQGFSFGITYKIHVHVYPWLNC